ncbi:MAG: dihydroorotate dehydrogenase-like protein [Bacteroidales bacterium]|jgi:dihydroorotate dehydrogenase (fumarate)|nr:dihydroorotate dehydrogenase-like protein [Bacteroidales bacterium]HOI31281.1 dihydroorotate dehydrogenase-like protein [Bacteroidales bacterium]
MIDLSTTYLGLALKSPIIAASSGFTDSVSKLKNLEKHGVGAVVLKSLFEEEITHEYDHTLKAEVDKTGRDEFLDYLDVRIRQENLEKYINLISKAKKELEIPVIASVNCKTAYEWISFTSEIEKVGADALELNVFVLPSNLNNSSAENEKIYFEIIKQVKKQVSIPIVLKISYYFSNLGNMIRELSHAGIGGLVLFNRFFSPDFDLDKLEVTPANVLSQPGEITMPLRWIALMHGHTGCDLSASTGVSDGMAVAKLLLAGATTVQVASALYNHGIPYLDVMHHELTTWMESHNFSKISDFRGKLSQKKYNKPDLFERVQFMRYFSDKESMI